MDASYNGIRGVPGPGANIDNITVGGESENDYSSIYARVYGYYIGDGADGTATVDLEAGDDINIIDSNLYATVGDDGDATIIMNAMAIPTRIPVTIKGRACGIMTYLIKLLPGVEEW